MNAKKPFKIVGSGKYLPQAVGSDELEARYGLPPSWSAQHSGVCVRHHATHETGAYMGARALEAALASAHLTLADIDLLIAAGGTFDYPLPSNAAVVKAELTDGHAVHCATFDVDTTCLSFVTALEVAARFLDGGQYRHIAIVTAEIASKGLSPHNPETLTLFGDAAVAVVVAYDDTATSYFVKGGLRTYSDGVEDTIIRGGGNRYFFRDFPYDERLHSFDMNGLALLKLARTHLPGFFDDFFDGLGLGLADVDVLLPHQASKVGLALFKRMYPALAGKMHENLEGHGNCIAASIPLLLHDGIQAGTIRRGDFCLLCGTSAGFSIGGVLIKY